MNKKQQILKELDAAIDAMDMDSIDRGLDALSAVDSNPIMAEDPSLFSARIQKLEKESLHMKFSRKSLRIAIAAAVVAVSGITVYAASAMHLFSFQTGDKFVTMRTTESMTEQEARALTSQSDTQKPSEPSNPAVQADTAKATFSTIQEAEQALGAPVVLPKSMPEMKPMEITGQTVKLLPGYENRTVWLTFEDNNGRMFGVTIVREIIPEGGSITSYTEHEVDEGSYGKYKSKTGVEYTTVNESNDDGSKTANIATAMVGEYEYSLVFMGFSDTERTAIIDSADLTPYQK